MSNIAPQNRAPDVSVQRMRLQRARHRCARFIDNISSPAALLTLSEYTRMAFYTALAALYGVAAMVTAIFVGIDIKLANSLEQIALDVTVCSACVIAAIVAWRADKPKRQRP